MIITKMTASYGRLQNSSMELSPGMNIISAPNESGKSTWSSFIKSMLYGVDSSAREKSGIKPDKVRFAPWGGAPMSGVIELEFEGREITLTRSGRESAPMREVSATLTGTGQTVKELNAAAPGETLLGVTREVFERSAYIGQGGVAVGASPELEKRIAAIVQTGDETSSYTGAEEKLRAALRKRRHNKSGLLPEIERELCDARERLMDAENETRRGAQLEQAKIQAIARRDVLMEKVAESRKDQRKQSLERLNRSRNEVKKAEENQQNAAAGLTHWEEAAKSGIFAAVSLADGRKQAEEDIKKLNFFKDDFRRGSSKKDLVLALVFALAAVAFELLCDMGILSLPGFWNFVPRIVFGLLALFFVIRTFRLMKRLKISKTRADGILSKYNCDSGEEVLALLDEHEKALNNLSRARAAKDRADKELTSSRERQAQLESSILHELDFSGSGPSAELTGRFEEADAQLHQIREQLAQWEGKQNLLGSREELGERIRLMEQEHAKLTLEYEALTLAADTLKDAGIEIQNRLTPRLSRRASEIFARLTGGRYESVALDRELKAAAKLSDDALARESSFLSVGALDQLYLAVRLAICELALNEDKPCPLILDDALANFDDERCRLALELLHEMSAGRQILLFSCHGREKDMTRGWENITVVNG